MFLFVLDPMDLRAMIGSLPADSTWLLNHKILIKADFWYLQLKKSA